MMIFKTAVKFVGGFILPPGSYEKFASRGAGNAEELLFTFLSALSASA